MESTYCMPTHPHLQRWRTEWVLPGLRAGRRAVKASGVSGLFLPLRTWYWLFVYFYEKRTTLTRNGQRASSCSENFPEYPPALGVQILCWCSLRGPKISPAAYRDLQAEEFIPSINMSVQPYTPKCHLSSLSIQTTGGGFAQEEVRHKALDPSSQYSKRGNFNYS